MAIVGAEGPPKNQLQARWGGISPGSGASGSLPGEFLRVRQPFRERKRLRVA